MKNLNLKKAETQTENLFIDFSKASPEGINAILSAMNAEVDAALSEKRFPSLDGAFLRMGTTPRTMM